jgi:glutaminyl-peptide cyclotransferase
MRILHVVFVTLFTLTIAPSWARAQAPLSRPFDGERAYRDLVRQCEFGPRVPATQAHAACAQWLAEQLYSCADQVDLQTATAVTPRGLLPLMNIVATFSPEAERRVLLCAHWDSRPRADRDPDPANRSKPILGANDGASGVAVLLEIARALKAHPPKQCVTIALLDGEDYGPGLEQMLLGSQAFARRWSGPLPAWAVLLDMIGDRDLRIAPERISLEQAPEVVDRIWSAAEREGCQAFVRESGPAVLDDHISLLRRGIPCIDVIDFDYPYWHTLEDTPDKCSSESLEQVGRVLLRAIAEDESGQSPSAAVIPAQNGQ